MKSKDKKVQLIQAARKLMAEKGYEKSSIKDIAFEAGVAPGLVHYYFKNKEEILTEVLLEASNDYTMDMEILRSSTPINQLSELALVHTKEKVKYDPDWYKLRYELFAIGLRNPSISDGVKRLIDNGRLGINSTLQELISNDTKETKILASILLACFDGLALQRLMDPDFDQEATYDLLEKMVLSIKDTQ